MHIKNKTYAEVYEVIKSNRDFNERIPDDIINHFKNCAKCTRYSLNYDIDKEIFSQLSREAITICISLYLQYIASSEEKEVLKKILIDNEIKFKTKN